MRAFVLVLLVLCAILGRASAHEVRPALLEATEQTPGVFEVLWKQPLLGDRRLKLEPRFPEACETDGEPQLSRVSGSVVSTWQLTCALDGGDIRIDGLEQTLTDVYVRLTYLDASPRAALLKPSAPVMSLDAAPVPVAGAYFRLGVEHILFGYDHLFFVAGLVLLVGGRRIIGVATAFTLAHSVTLVAAALDLISVPAWPVETLIAVSILLLAIEVIRRRGGGDSLAIRYPWSIAFLIGLVHGCGFAGALSEIGLPKDTELWALALFNIGVEAGQVFVVGVLLAVFWIVARVSTGARNRAELAMTYGIGAVGAFWTIQRLAIPFAGTG